MNIVRQTDGQCGWIQPYIDSYLHNELSIESKNDVYRHLEDCERCARSVENRARLRAQLKRAVMQEFAPGGLRDRVASDLRRRRFRFGRLTFAFAAAAAALVIAGVTLTDSGPTHRALSFQAHVAAGDAAGQVLRIGLDDHVFCAIDHDLASRQFTPIQMAESLGTDYAGLVAIVEQNLRGTYTLAVGHRCHYQGREFVHLIMRNERNVASLVVTRKNGETFQNAGDEARVPEKGVPVYRRAWANYEVAGLETRDHLVFVVSNETSARNSQIAESLAQPVHDLLARMES